MSKYHKTDAAIRAAIDDGVCTIYRIERVAGVYYDGSDGWIVYSGNDGERVFAYACAMEGMLATASTVRGLARDSAKTYPTKSAAVAAVRRAETRDSKYVKVAVRRDRVFVY